MQFLQVLSLLRYFTSAFFACIALNIAFVCILRTLLLRRFAIEFDFFLVL